MLGALVLTVLQAGPPWQQDVRYRIRAALDEHRFMLAGSQEVLYRNRSPDTLQAISFHLHLNAFRPGSRWTERDAREGLHRFDRLADPDHGLHRVTEVAVDGVGVTPIWPFAPDSTVVRFPLPRPLPPGDSLTVTMRWEARPSTVALRQGRRGRHYDFAHWYPRVVVYDRHGWNEQPLYPAGEFYGEFGTYLVRLEVPDDQVIGATGVPLCGDPGWTRARRPAGARVTYQRDWYPAPSDPAARGWAADCPAAAPGRKIVVWYAENVHHFGLSMNPEFRYEEGDVFGRPVRVLYQPGAERSWGAGLAARRAETALVWLDELFGPWPWPQLTIVHRIEPGGTGFPMMMMNGDPGQQLILHTAGHNYLMGILANNEWREGWLDEGFTGFQATWFHEILGRRGAYQTLERQVLGWDLDRLSEPVARPGEQFRDFATYRRMTYARGELFFHQLRAIVGDDTMRRILRAWFAGYRFRHVDEAAFQRVADSVSGRDLSGFFRQWLHQTVLWDYRPGAIRREQAPDGWRTTVEVVAAAPGRFPVVVEVAGAEDTVRLRAPGIAQRETLTVITRSTPRVVTVDPDGVSHDWNYLNNTRRFGLLGRRPRVEPYADAWFTRRERRDRLTLGVTPTAWYNDAGGWTLGWRLRSDYLGRFNRHEYWGAWATGAGTALDRTGPEVWMAFRNPVWIRAPGVSSWVSGGVVEGRAGAELGMEYRRPGFDGPADARTGARIRYLTTGAVEDLAFLDRRLWDDAWILEAEARTGLRAGDVLVEAAVAGGVTAPRRVAGPATRGYVRATLEARAEQPLGDRWALALRGFGGYVTPGGATPRQRQLPLGSRDPVEQWTSPLLRSSGALLRRDGVHYHDPGGAGLRALSPPVLARRAAGVTVEIHRRLRDGGSALFHRVTLAGFADAAVADGDLDPGRGTRFRGVVDAGLGLRADHRIGGTRFQTRVDLPLWVSRPELAQDDGPGSRRLGVRWLFSFVPAVGPFPAGH